MNELDLILYQSIALETLYILFFWSKTIGVIVRPEIQLTRAPSLINFVSGGISGTAVSRIKLDPKDLKNKISKAIDWCVNLSNSIKIEKVISTFDTFDCRWRWKWRQIWISTNTRTGSTLFDMFSFFNTHPSGVRKWIRRFSFKDAPSAADGAARDATKGTQWKINATPCYHSANVFGLLSD